MTDQEIAQRFAGILQDALLEIDPTINFRWRRMFGGAGYYANDRMFAAWYRGESIALKLPARERESLLHIEGAWEAGKNYVEVPQSFLTDVSLLAEWVEKSLKYTEATA